MLSAHLFPNPKSCYPLEKNWWVLPSSFRLKRSFEVSFTVPKCSCTIPQLNSSLRFWFCCSLFEPRVRTTNQGNSFWGISCSHSWFVFSVGKWIFVLHLFKRDEKAIKENLSESCSPHPTLHNWLVMLPSLLSIRWLPISPFSTLHSCALLSIAEFRVFNNVLNNSLLNWMSWIQMHSYAEYCMVLHFRFKHTVGTTCMLQQLSEYLRGEGGEGLNRRASGPWSALRYDETTMAEEARKEGTA